MIHPKECLTKAEIRVQIDQLDNQIIKLLGLRFDYVKEIVKYKSDTDSINANERVAQVLVQRRKWAEENGLNPELIEFIFKTLIDYFIGEEHKIFKNQNYL